jgi:hypothetical protein
MDVINFPEKVPISPVLENTYYLTYNGGKYIQVLYPKIDISAQAEMWRHVPFIRVGGAISCETIASIHWK